MKKELLEKYLKVQEELNAPKNQRNNFGGYNYRSCEDILEAVKPLLKKYKLALTLMDELVNIGDRYYVKAIAKLVDIENPMLEDDEISVMNMITNTAYAREEETKKGMDGSQITGTASSYARKYALNGLFLIDDNKDADTNEYHNQVNEKPIESKATKKQIDYIKTLEVDLIGLYNYYKVEKLEDLTAKQASEIIKAKGGKK